MRLGDAYDLDIEDGSVDVAFAGNLLHHLERTVDALQEMARVDETRSNLLAMVHAAGLKVKARRAHGWVYENRSPSASLTVARRLEARTAGGAYWLVVAGAAGRSS
jgi:ubiquinone/menaquinone biosynthesis C-methylase UbiE